MYRPGHLRVPGIPVECGTWLALHPDEGFQRILDAVQLWQRGSGHGPVGLSDL